MRQMRADRLLSLLLLLQARGRITAQDLAQRLEVSERTIYRDLDALSAAGVPIDVERGRHAGCMLVEGYCTDDLLCCFGQLFSSAMLLCIADARWRW
jgi:predicted DNA-binding transcriptional regulator YafY